MYLKGIDLRTVRQHHSIVDNTIKGCSLMLMIEEARIAIDPKYMHASVLESFNRGPRIRAYSQRLHDSGYETLGDFHGKNIKDILSDVPTTPENENKFRDSILSYTTGADLLSRDASERSLSRGR